MKGWIVFVVPLCSLFIGSPIHAAPFQCTLQSASIVFGNYSSSQNRDVIGNIAMYCNGRGKVAIRLSTGSSRTYSNRTLIGSGFTLNYNLYANNSYTIVWGDTTAGTQQVVGFPAGAGTLNFPVYGRIPAGQSGVPVGNYTDSLTVTWAFDATLSHFTHSGSMTATASIVRSCTISASPMTFGNLGLSLVNTSSSQNATLSYTCSRGTAAQITLDQGQNGTGTLGAPVRRMKSGTNFVGYQLYSNSAMTVVWDGLTGIAISGTGSPQNSTVYGQVPAQSPPAVGTYNDAVVVTINF